MITLNYKTGLIGYPTLEDNGNLTLHAMIHLSILKGQHFLVESAPKEVNGEWIAIKVSEITGRHAFKALEIEAVRAEAK